MSLNFQFKPKAALLLLLLVYVLAGHFGLSLAVVNPSATAVWAPTGIALAAMLLWGLQVWPIILLGAFLVNILNTHSLLASLMIAGGNTLEALAGAFLVIRYAHGRHAFDRERDIIKFALFAAILATTLSATIGVCSIVLNGLATWSDSGRIWLTWWLGNAAGAMIVTPMLVLLTNNRAIRWNQREVVEALFLLLLMILVSFVIFDEASPLGQQKYPLAFLTLVPILLAGFRFGQREVAALSIVLSGVAIAGTLNGAGPFSWYSSNTSLLLLQIFIALEALIGLILAAVVAEKNQTAHGLLLSEQRYRALAEAATDCVISITSDGVMTYVNPSAEQLFGYRADELLGQNLVMLMPERLRSTHSNSLSRYLATGTKRTSWSGVELPGLRRDQSEIALEVSFGEYLQDGIHQFIGIMRDISERKRNEETKQWLATIVETSDDAILSKTLDHTILSWNSGAQQIYGYTADEMVGRSASVLVLAENMDEWDTMHASIRRGEHILHHETVHIRKDGTRIHVSLSISPIVDKHGVVKGISSIARDISKRHQFDERIRHLAQYDSLTGLPNRMLCYDRIRQAIRHAHRDQHTVGLLFLDLDGFKPINDALGHLVGDEVLRIVARRLQQGLREGDTVGRFGGDEFVVCLPAFDNSGDSIADQLLNTLSVPMMIEGHECRITASIGISLYPRDGEDNQALVRAADTAMYQAKAAGGNCYRQFSPEYGA